MFNGSKPQSIYENWMAALFVWLWGFFFFLWGVTLIEQGDQAVGIMAASLGVVIWMAIGNYYWRRL